MTADLISCYCQDELEFGYVDSPHQRFPVVLDSPRNGKIKDFPYKTLLVSDTLNSSLEIIIYLNFQSPNCLYRKKVKTNTYEVMNRHICLVMKSRLTGSVISCVLHHRNCLALACV